MSQVSLSYRPDIDGLRAIAVGAVLLFHAFPAKLPGGFVGVDIFFVISGYLISGIILKELDAGRFTIAGFYSRRIRRIFPALVLVLVATLLVGWGTLGPDEFRRLAKHTVGGVGFVSNLIQWRESGYFDPAGQSNLLLHLWSLGIEEQFYIFWPLLLAALFRRTRKLLPAIGAIALASFCYNVATVSSAPVSAYYSPVTRTWELLIGAALAYGMANGPRLPGIWAQAAAIAGCALIGVSLAITSEATPFPGWWALPPTLGAAMLILAGRDTWVNRRVLSSRGFVFIGLISYPLYLWHWPLLTYFRLVNESDWDLPYAKVRLIRIGLLALACLLSWMTWRFWETPIRTAKQFGALPTVPALALAMTGVLAVGVAGNSGWISPRLNSPEVQRIFRASSDWDPLPYNNFLAKAFRATEIRSKRAEFALFVGDSHLEQYAPRVKSAIQQNRDLSSAVFLTHGGCPPLPLLNPDKPGFDCPKFYRFWTEEAGRAKTVVIAAYWEMYFTPAGRTGPSSARLELVNRRGEPASQADIDGAWKALEVTVREWVASGKRVAFLLSSPASERLNPLAAFRRLGRTDPARLHPVKYAEFQTFLAPVEARLRSLSANTGAQLIRTADYFCENGDCPAVDAQGEPLYLDDNHLRARTAERRATFIDELLTP